MNATVILVNPHAGRARRGLVPSTLEQAVRAVFGDPVQRITSEGPGDLARAARAATERGAERLVVVGGDGSLNEVLNGTLACDGHWRERDRVPELVPVPLGTGSDFQRTFAPRARDLEEALRLAVPQRVDVGVVECVGRDGSRVRRAFLNVASFGLSAQVAASANRLPRLKRLLGPLIFTWTALAALPRYRAASLQLSIDGIARELSLATCAVANGRWFGGGMHVAPSALAADGVLDVVSVGDRARWRLIQALLHVRRGSHLELPGIEIASAHRLVATPTDASRRVPVEADGEALGYLPATFSVLPEAVRVRA